MEQERDQEHEKDLEQEIRKIVKEYLHQKPNKQNSRRRRAKKNFQRGGDSAYQDAVAGLNSATSMMEKLRVSNIPAGSTSGSFTALANNIIGLVDSTINTVVDTVVFADQLISLPSNLGTAYNEPLAQTSFNF